MLNADEQTTVTPSEDGGEKLFTQTEVNSVIKNRLEREKRTRGDSAAENLELVNDLRVMRDEIDQLKATHKQQLSTQKTGFEADISVLNKKDQAYKADLALSSALSTAGIRDDLKEGALALLKSKGISTMDSDGKMVFKIGDKTLKEAIESLPESYIGVAGSGGSGSQSSTQSGSQGSKNWAMKILANPKQFRKLSPKEQTEVMEAVKE